MLKKGLIQIYTGTGKGKTTAALGLALRAAGHGNDVLFCQFLKPASIDSGERKAIENIPNITIRILQHPWDMKHSFDDPAAVKQAKTAIQDMLKEISLCAKNKQFDMIILDEIVFCINKNLACLNDIKSIINSKNPHVELVLTGRGASDELIELANLVTEMKPLKHPYDSGISARKGIEY